MGDRRAARCSASRETLRWPERARSRTGSRARAPDGHPASFAAAHATSVREQAGGGNDLLWLTGAGPRQRRDRTAAPLVILEHDRVALAGHQRDRAAVLGGPV